jgi:hypothetical protein
MQIERFLEQSSGAERKKQMTECRMNFLILSDSSLLCFRGKTDNLRVESRGYPGRRPEISDQFVVCVTAAKIAFLELKVGS